MPVKQELASFVRSTFRSVWSLELLSLLRRSGESTWTPTQLVAALRASDLVVSQSVESLLAAGLIVVETDNTVRYQPVSPEVDGLVEATEELYAKRPDAVRRLIVAKGSDGLIGFAEAFKIRDD
ncbi:MAG: hypothetical protein EOP21_04655 [Hyphomicrobiales bacterium]|nr:MAG: hypothetical protein EOP21_04655 [Hyphomicrobiales bacterium]